MIASPSKAFVEEVEDARLVFRQLPKNPDAAWVAGLEDEEQQREALLGAEYVPQGATSWNADADAFSGGRRGGRPPRQRAWLRYEAFWLIASVALFTSTLLNDATADADFHHPVDEQVLWEVAKLEWMPRVIAFATYNVPFLLAAFAATLLSIKLGAATESFIVLCGVGSALLVAVAVALDLVLLERACPQGALSRECDYPFGSHWCCSAVKNIGVSGALGCAAFALGIADRPRRGFVGPVLGALPVAANVVFYVITFYYGAAFAPVFVFATRVRFVILVLWAVLAVMFYQQPRLLCVPGAGPSANNNNGGGGLRALGDRPRMVPASDFLPKAAAPNKNNNNKGNNDDNKHSK